MEPMAYKVRLINGEERWVRGDADSQVLGHELVDVVLEARPLASFGSGKRFIRPLAKLVTREAEQATWDAAQKKVFPNWQK